MGNPVNDFEKEVLRHALMKTVPEITEIGVSTNGEHLGKPIYTISVVFNVNNFDFFKRYTSPGRKYALETARNELSKLVKSMKENNLQGFENLKMFFEEQVLFRYFCEYEEEIPVKPEERAKAIKETIGKHTNFFEMTEEIFDNVAKMIIKYPKEKQGGVYWKRTL